MTLENQSFFPVDWSIDIQKLSHSSNSFLFEASATERDHLRDYVNAQTVKSFVVKLTVKPFSGGRYKVKGSLSTVLVQSSVITLAPVDTNLESEFNVEYWPQATLDEFDQESLSSDADLPEALDQDRIDIGRLVCELFSLEVEAYPKNEEDRFEWKDEERSLNPFSSLHYLHRKEDNS